MNFFWIWGGTILFTEIIEYIRKNDFYKFIGDCGYKFDYNKKEELDELFDDCHLPITFLSIVVPFYNTLASIFRCVQYYFIKDQIVDKIEEDDYLIRMSFEEEFKFRKHHNGRTLNNISKESINKQSEELAENVSKLAYDDGVVYYILHDLNNIEIVKTEGALCEFSNEELIKRIKSYEIMLCNVDNELENNDENLFKQFNQNHNEIQIYTIHYSNGTISFYIRNDCDIVITNITGKISELSDEEVMLRIQYFLNENANELTLKK